MSHDHATIDIHAHWYPQHWLHLVEKDGPKEGASRLGNPYDTGVAAAHLVIGWRC
jgi:hypothetical protein